MTLVIPENSKGGQRLAIRRNQEESAHVLRCLVRSPSDAFFRRLTSHNLGSAKRPGSPSPVSPSTSSTRFRATLNPASASSTSSACPSGSAGSRWRSPRIGRRARGGNESRRRSMMRRLSRRVCGVGRDIQSESHAGNMEISS